MLPDSLETKDLLVKEANYADGMSITIHGAQRKQWLLQFSVEGTHRDLVQVVLTVNH